MDSNIKDIWQSFNTQLLSYIKHQVNDENIAEDLLHEVFIKLYKNVDKLEEQSKLKPWLYQITKNTIIDYYRKRKETPIAFQNLEKEFETDDIETNMNDETVECLKALIFELPEKYQKSIELYDMKGLKHKDISQKLNISISGSKTRVQRARSKLKEVLCDCCDFELDTFGNIIEYRQKKNYSCGKDKCEN